jgi:glycosyltransferase involved in cell wall biosynthesis
MVVIYLHQFFFPGERAHTVQMMHTGAGLAARGVETHLFGKPNPALPIDSVEAGVRFYGLEPSPRLKIHLAPTSVRSRASLWNRWRALRTLTGHQRRGEVIVFVRKLHVVQELARFRRLTRFPFRIVIEMHDIPSLLESSYAEVEDRLGGESGGKHPALREGRELAGADGVICITDATRRLLAGTTKRPISMITIRSGARVGGDDTAAPGAANGRGDDATGSERTRESSGTRTVMYVGQLLPWKGVEVLVQAMAELPPHIHCEVVGGDSAGQRVAELSALARDAGVGDRIAFRGFVPHGAIGAAYRRADCLLLPNSRTVIGGFCSSPIKLFEYMASGVPIVASDLPSIREVLSHNENAVLVEPDSPRALAAGIRTVLEDSALASRLAARARREVPEFSWDRRTDRLVDFFRGIIAG